jgi:hypothetical protein
LQENCIDADEKYLLYFQKTFACPIMRIAAGEVLHYCCGNEKQRTVNSRIPMPANSCVTRHPGKYKKIHQDKSVAVVPISRPDD